MCRNLSALLLLTVCAGVAGCRTAAPSGSGTVTQVCTIDALLAGAYDGQFPLRDLLCAGNFGIGTFDRLDGEMVLLDGQVYQVRADGRVARPALSMRTPFACVVPFEGGRRVELSQPSTADEIRRGIDQGAGSNVIVAIRIDGTFTRMRTRSVPAQNKPYPPLAEVTRAQPEFGFEHIKGTLVGFRLPAFVKGLNVPGYHLHFISADRRCGGHVLDFALEQGHLSVVSCREWRLWLPPDDHALDGLDLGIDRSRELDRVER